ncbi:MAG: DnaD domain protein, partial [Clostridiales bacterium]|nr:DnaD domain protein [Clostridiales bacterium]
IDWVENGIHTVEDAKEYVRLFNTDYREIMKAFGIGRREPASAEIKYMQEWLITHGLPLEVILEACDRTVMQTNGPNFPYADKIIATWRETGVQTLEDIKKTDEEFTSAKKKSADSGAAARGKPESKGKKQNRFANFDQREWDYAEIEKTEQQLLENAVMS